MLSRATADNAPTLVVSQVGEQDRALPVGGIAVAVSNDGNQLYVASHGYHDRFTSKLSVIDMDARRITEVPIDGIPNALAAKANRIYLTDSWHSTLVQVTARSTTVIDPDAANYAPNLTITQGGAQNPGTRTVVFHASFSDCDDDEISYTATQPFSGTVTDLGDGRFEYTPNGARSRV